MRRTRYWQLATLHVLVFALASCAIPPQTAPPFQTPAPPSQTRATLAFVVTDTATGQPIAGAVVGLHTGEQGTTDAAGYVAFDDLLLGERGVTIAAAGYLERFHPQHAFTGNTQVPIALEAIAPPVPPRPVHPAPIVGQLRTDGDRCFADDTGCRILAAYHGGDLFALFAAGQVEAVRADLAAAAAAGYQIVRSWVALNDGGDPHNIWVGPHYRGVGPRLTPDYTGQLVAFARLLDSYGLKWHMAAGGIDGMSTAVEESMMRAWADAMAEAGADKWALVEACNECRDTADRDGDNEPGHLEHLIDIVRRRHPQVLYTLTAYTGTEDPAELRPYQPSWVPFTYYHGYRGQDIDDKIRHRVSMALESGLGRLFWDGEPGGPWSRRGIPGDPLTSVSAQANDHEYDDESVAAMHMATVIGRGITAYMSATGVRRYISPTTFPGFAAVPRLLRMIPSSAHTGQLTHGGRGDAPIASTTNGAGHLGRADQLVLPDGQLIALLYGERPGSYRYPLRRGLRGSLIHPGTGEAHQIDLPAGATLAVDMRWARVFVGRVR